MTHSNGEAIAKRHCFAYTRVSSKTQGRVDADGPKRQRQTVSRCADAEGFEVVCEFMDIGVSGATEFENRAGMAALIEACASSGVKTVLVENMDRIARDLIIGELLLEKLREGGCQVFDCSGNDLTDKNDRTRNVIRQILGAIAEYNKHMLVDRMHAAQVRIRASGRKCGGAPKYGQRKDKPEEKAILDRMKRERAEGMKIQQIADGLNRDGIKNARGLLWRKQLVSHILGPTRRVTSSAAKSQPTER